MIESNAIGSSQASPIQVGETRHSTSPSVQTKPEGQIKHSPSTFAPDIAVAISEEAKTKMNNEAETLKFIRKIQAQPEDQSRRTRVDELKQQLATPEGKTAFIASINLEKISQNILSQNQLT